MNNTIINRNTKKKSVVSDGNNAVKNGGAIMDDDTIDYDKLKIARYVKINWGWFPGAPPTDCNIM